MINEEMEKPSSSLRSRGFAVFHFRRQQTSQRDFGIGL